MDAAHEYLEAGLSGKAGDFPAMTRLRINHWILMDF